MNRFICVGRLSRDIELRYINKGMAVAQSSVALNERWKTESGETKERVTFVDFAVWGPSGETLSKHFAKGDGIVLEGRLQMDVWEDKSSREKRSKLKLVVERWEFPPGRSSDHDRSTPSSAPTSRPSAQPSTATDSGSEDDVPF